MKKNLKLLGIMLLTIFALTGCVFNSEITVNKDGSADVTYMVAVTDEEMGQLESSGYSKDEFIQPAGIDERTGEETKVYSQDGLQGNTYTKHIDNITDINIAQFYADSVIVTPYDNDEEYKNNTDDNAKIPPQFTVKQNIFVKKVILDANLDLSAANLQDYGIAQDYSFKLSTKGVITKANATTNRGGVAEWKLKFDQYDVENKDSGNPLKATICFYNFFAIGIVVIIVLAIVCAIVFAVMKSKGKSEKQDSENK